MTVIGKMFSVTGRARCRFGDVVVHASSHSSSRLECRVPPGQQRNISVQVSNDDGLTFEAQTLSFEYRLKSNLLQLHPSSSGVRGGTVVTVSGLQASCMGQVLDCAFGDSTSRGEVLNTTSGVCSVPSQRVAGAVDFVVGCGSAPGERTVTTFLYLEDAVVTGLRPSEGSLLGGSLIDVTGLFFAGRQVTCSFGHLGSRVNASVVSSTLLRVLSPVGAAGEVAVEVSLNGVDFTRDGVVFEYRAEAELISIEPSKGPERGGTVVTVRTRWLAKTAGLGCRIGGGRRVQAKWHSSTRASCVTPEHSPGNLTMRLSISGRDVGGRGAAYVVEEALVVTELSPSKGPSGGNTAIVLTNHASFANAVAPGKLRRGSRSDA